MTRQKKWLAGIMIVVIITLFSCAGAEKYEYRSDREEAEGSGILSGDDGYFEIYKKESP